MENLLPPMQQLSATPWKFPFAWNEIAQPNFFNGTGLPAEPFRTGDP
jgi:hypothetical protein